jgi:TonB family protein
MKENDMFETSVIKARAVASPRRIGFLSASIGFHSFAAFAAVVLSVQATSFPTNAPNQLSVLMPSMPIDMRPPQGTETARPKPQAAVAPQKAQTAPPDAAPAVVPDNVMPAQSSSVATDTSATPGPAGPSGDGTGTRGVPWGDPNVVDIGQPLPTEPQPSVGPLTPGGEVRAATVLHRVEPVYPMVAVKTGMSGVVRLHCVIDRNGRPREVEVVSSTFTAFNQPALDAMQRWTFAPGTLRGQPVDTYFELTITFHIR